LLKYFSTQVLPFFGKIEWKEPKRSKDKNQSNETIVAIRKKPNFEGLKKQNM